MFTYNLEEIWVRSTNIFSCTCSVDSNQCPFELISSYRNRKKSAGNITGLQCGWGTTAAVYYQNFWTDSAVFTAAVMRTNQSFLYRCFSHAKKTGRNCDSDLPIRTNMMYQTSSQRQQ